LKRTSAAGEVRTYDILAADDFQRPLDVTYYAGLLAQVSYQLTAKPYSRGTEVDLGLNTTTGATLVFTETGLAGDVLGLGRMVFTNNTATAQRWLIWGIQSRHYSSAGTAALFYEAESLTLGSGALNAGPAGASGTGNKTVYDNGLETTPSASMYYDGTHVGSYRVYARVQVPATNTGTVSVRLTWSHHTLIASNSWVAIDPAHEGTWRIVDLGTVSLTTAATGPQGWRASWQALSTASSGDAIHWDWVMLVPIDEGSGVAFGSDDNGPTYALEASGGAELSSRYYVARLGGTYYGPVSYAGDYLLVPPSGAEGRTVRVIAKVSRGLQGAPADAPVATGSDAGIDGFSARLFYTPRYLT
jgi:hypothetical protein